MAEYLTPGVFMEDIDSVVSMPLGTDPTAAFVGVAATGPVGEPVIVNSWNAYLNNFATGQDSAFLTNSKLAYAVYGFFQNGGKKCYILRVTNGTISGDTISFNATASSSTGPTTESESDSEQVYGDFATIFAAKSQGTWGNSLKIEIPKSGINTTLGTFTLRVLNGTTVVESWGNLKSGVNVQGCYADVINAESSYIKVTDLTKVAPLSTLASASETTPTLTFSGGTDGLASSGQPVPDTVYEKSLSLLDFYDDIRLVAIPAASHSLQVAVATYCTNSKYRIAICEGLETDTDLTTLRNSLEGLNAVLYNPWIKVVNPLSSSGALITVPACGHICGIYARISNTRGFWKAPAGTEATVRGAVSVQKILTTAETDVANPKGINSIIPKTNYGIVLWGARSCNSNFSYESDLYTNITIKKNLYDLTQRFTFGPHDEKLWTKVKTTCQDYLNSLYQQGAFFGDTPDKAYFVKCDEELNPPSIRNQGKLYVEVGYASKKPAEFIIFRIAHELTSNV